MTDATLSDRLVVQIAADLSPLTQGLSQAGRDMSQFVSGPIDHATREMDRVFNATFGGLERAILKSVKTGTFSFRDMVNSIIADLSRIAVEEAIIKPIESIARSVLDAILHSISGRAGGGPVSPGSAYMVGERGPELFVPSGGGEIVPGMARSRPSVVVNVQASDAQSFLKSETQIAAMMARALARGQRNL